MRNLTRKEWYDQYRESRIERKKNYKPGLNSSTLNEMFKDHYTHFYGKDQTKYNLICRYESKISPRLKYQKKLIRAAAKEAGKAILIDMVCKESKLIDLIRKDKFVGRCLVVPTKYGEETK